MYDWLDMKTNLKDELEKLRKDTNFSGLWITILFYTLLCVAFGLFAWLSAIHWIWLIPCMGWIQYYIVISGHEAVHKTLCPQDGLNEFLGVVGQALVGVNFTAYRLQHMDHHRCPSHHTDPDAHIYHGVLNKPAGLYRFMWLTVGTFVEILVKIKQKGSGGYGTKRDIKPEIQRKSRRDSLLVVGSQLALMGLSYFVIGHSPIVQDSVGYVFSAGILSTLVGVVLSYAVVWIIPLFAVTVFLNRCRIVIEHGLALAIVQEKTDFAGMRIPTVEIVPNTLEKWIFAPFSFNYHCSHHCYMGVPHYNLPKLHALLQETNSPGFLCVQGGYLQALWRVVFVEYTENTNISE